MTSAVEAMGAKDVRGDVDDEGLVAGLPLFLPVCLCVAVTDAERSPSLFLRLASCSSVMSPRSESDPQCVRAFVLWLFRCNICTFPFLCYLNLL